MNRCTSASNTPITKRAEMKRNILVYRWDIYPYDDIIQTWKEQGHHVDVPALSAKNHLQDEAFEQQLTQRLMQRSYHFVFSINYFANIARVCHSLHIPYLSWTVDTPLIALQTPTVFYPENRIFVFDKKEQAQLAQRGVQNVFHLPLAGNPNRIGSISNDAKDNGHFATKYPVSFVGNLYDKNQYDEMCSFLPDYLCGYLDAAVEAQLHVSGGNIFSEIISDQMFQELQPFLRLDEGFHSCFDPEDLDRILRMQFITRVLCHKAAASMRVQTLNHLARQFPVHLFTTSDTSPLLQVHSHKAVDYHTQMPQIFTNSRINLNITAPNIESGIPLRVWDILSAGGFLLTDYRQEYNGLLQNGCDFVLYDGLEDLVQKVSYYLAHEEERLAIAQNGYQCIIREHNYANRLEKMLRTL